MKSNFLPSRVEIHRLCSIEKASSCQAWTASRGRRRRKGSSQSRSRTYSTSILPISLGRPTSWTTGKFNEINAVDYGEWGEVEPLDLLVEGGNKPFSKKGVLRGCRFH